MPSHIQNSITSKASDPYMKPVPKTSFNCLCIVRHPSTCKMHKLNLSMTSLIKFIHDKFLWCVTQHMPPPSCVFPLPLRAPPLASQILLSTPHICASNCEGHFFFFANLMFVPPPPASSSFFSTLPLLWPT